MREAAAIILVLETTGKKLEAHLLPDHELLDRNSPSKYQSSFVRREIPPREIRDLELQDILCKRSWQHSMITTRAQSAQRRVKQDRNAPSAHPLCSNRRLYRNRPRPVVLNRAHNSRSLGI
jgi:hypothetical protein